MESSWDILRSKLEDLIAEKLSKVNKELLEHRELISKLAEQVNNVSDIVKLGAEPIYLKPPIIESPTGKPVLDISYDKSSLESNGIAEESIHSHESLEEKLATGESSLLESSNPLESTQRSDDLTAEVTSEDIEISMEIDSKKPETEPKFKRPEEPKVKKSEEAKKKLKEEDKKKASEDKKKASEDKKQPEDKKRPEDKKATEEEKKKAAEEGKKKKAEEAELKKKAAEEAKKKKAEEAELKKKAAEEAELKKKAAEEAKKKKAEDAKRKKAEEAEEAKRKKAEEAEEAKKKKAEEEALKKKKKAEEEAEKKKASEEAKKKKAEEEAEKKKAAEEAKKKKPAEEELEKKKASEEAKKKKPAEEAKKKKPEDKKEQPKKLKEEETKVKKGEEGAKKKAEDKKSDSKAKKAEEAKAKKELLRKKTEKIEDSQSQVTLVDVQVHSGESSPSVLSESESLGEDSPIPSDSEELVQIAQELEEMDGNDLEFPPFEVPTSTEYELMTLNDLGLNISTKPREKALWVFSLFVQLLGEDGSESEKVWEVSQEVLKKAKEQGYGNLYFRNRYSRESAQLRQDLREPYQGGEAFKRKEEFAEF